MHLLLLFPLLFRLSGSSAVITGPGQVSGPEQGSLTVQCRYDPGWESYVKYWCQRSNGSKCKNIVQTTGSEQEVKKDRVSIRDNQTSLTFTVTMEKLRWEDAGTYWCGIGRTRTDHEVLVKVTTDSGSSDPSAVITGPEEVSGPEQGSLTVQCRYVPGWETYRKYWCRGAEFRSCIIVVSTTGSQRRVEGHRLSIRDNQTSRIFTVTMEKLRREDAGTYWCGIMRIGSDHGVPVKVTIGPATTTVSTTIPTTTTFTVPVTTVVPTSSPTVSSLHPEGRDASKVLHILLPLLSALLLLFLVAASLLVWRIMKRRKKAAGMPPEQVLQPLESDVCYANLTLQQPGSTPGSARKRASGKHSSAQEGWEPVEYVTTASFPKEDISYAALSLDALDQEATYANTSDLVTHLPSRSHEELTEYSTIMKP